MQTTFLASVGRANMWFRFILSHPLVMPLKNRSDTIRPLTTPVEARSPPYLHSLYSGAKSRLNSPMARAVRVRTSSSVSGGTAPVARWI